MRNINCDEILPREEFASLNDSDYEEQVIRFCQENLTKYKNDLIENYNGFIINAPSKVYEVFKLNSKISRIFLLNTNQINYNGDECDKELYYTANAAYKICLNKKILNEDATLGNAEIQADFKEEKDKLEKEIEQLIDNDNNCFNEDRFIFNTLDGSIILEEYNKVSSFKTNLENENKILKEKLKDNENTIIDLSNKLKISLDNIEKSRDNLSIKSKSKFENLFDRLKEILK